MIAKTTSFIFSISLLTGASLAVTTGIAHAYIDVGTGSLVLQMLLAGFFGSLFALKVFWHRITGRLSRLISSIRTRESSER